VAAIHNNFWMFDPGAALPFFGYRRFGHDGPVGHELAPSLAHFYESEKFRTTNDELRQTVLDCSSPTAAQKLAKRHRASWRADWRTVRGRVLRAGLAMQCLQSKEAMRMARDAFERSMELASMRRVCSLPGPFLAAEIQAFFAKPTAQQPRVGGVCLNGFVPEDLRDRLDAVFKLQPPISATLYAGGDADPGLEMWCADRAVPIRLLHGEQGRFKEGNAADHVARVSTLIVCAPSSRKSVIALKTAAKRSRLAVLDLTSKG